LNFHFFRRKSKRDPAFTIICDNGDTFTLYKSELPEKFKEVCIDTDRFDTSLNGKYLDAAWKAVGSKMDNHGLIGYEHIFDACVSVLPEDVFCDDCGSWEGFCECSRSPSLQTRCDTCGEREHLCQC